jgi:hypothetical protein
VLPLRHAPAASHTAHWPAAHQPLAVLQPLQSLYHWPQKEFAPLHGLPETHTISGAIVWSSGGSILRRSNDVCADEMCSQSPGCTPSLRSAVHTLQSAHTTFHATSLRLPCIVIAMHYAAHNFTHSMHHAVPHRANALRYVRGLDPLEVQVHEPLLRHRQGEHVGLKALAKYGERGYKRLEGA